MVELIRSDMKEKISGIYMIRNKANGKVYVGSAVNVKNRWIDHRKTLRGSRHHSDHLQKAWNKYDEQSFDFVLLEQCIPEVLIMREQNWIDFFRSYDGRFGYNMSPTAGNCLGVKHSEETRKKLSESKKGQWTGEKNPNFRRTYSDEERKQMSERMKGKYIGEDNWNYGNHYSEEARKRISESRKGKYCGENNPNYGKHHSEEAKKKIAEANARRVITEETRAKMRGKIRTEEQKKKASESWKKRFEEDPQIRQKMRERMLGTKHTEEEKKKISEGNKGKMVSEESKEKNRQAHLGLNAGEKNVQSKLTWEQVREIRAKYIPEIYSSIKLAREYGVNKSTILQILHNKRWKEENRNE